MAENKRLTKMMTIGEVARLFNVHTNTVRRWSEQGILKAYRVGTRGDRKFRRKDIASFYLERAIKKHLKS